MVPTLSPKNGREGGAHSIKRASFAVYISGDIQREAEFPLRRCSPSCAVTFVSQANAQLTGVNLGHSGQPCEPMPTGKRRGPSLGFSMGGFSQVRSPLQR